MRKPTLTIDTFVAALAVLSIGTSAGCSKAEKASPVTAEPATAAPPKTLASAPTTTPAAPVAATPIADAGADARGREDKKPGSASCGAGTCSADMKKGN